MLSTILPMLLGGGMTIGGGSGGYGGGYGGGFGSGYAPGYGSYGYPTYPPPMPNSGFGASGFPLLIRPRVFALTAIAPA